MLDVSSTESLLKAHSPAPWTFWSVSHGIVVLIPFLISPGVEIVGPEW